MTLSWMVTVVAAAAAGFFAACLWLRWRLAARRRDREADFRQLLDCLPVLVQAVDARGRLVAFNRECERVLGYSASEALGDPELSARLYPDPDALGRESALEIIAEEGVEVCTRSGEVRTISWAPMSVEVPGWASSAVGVDVTERQRMDRTLGLLRFAVDNTPAAMFTLAPDGRVLDVNETACQVLEYEREELLAMTVADFDLLYPEDRWPAEWQELRQKRQMVTESIHRTKSGRKIPVEVSVGVFESGGQEYCSAFVRDIGERKQTEAEKQTVNVLSRLFLTAESLEAIFEQVPRILCRRFDFPVAMIELFESETGEMLTVGSHGVPAAAGGPLRVPVHQTISGTVAKTGRPVIESDALRRSDYRFFLLRKLELRAFVCVPLKIEARVVGTLTLADSRRRELSPAFGDTLQTVANHLAKEIERKRAQEALEASEDRWRSLLENLPDSVSLLDLDGRVLVTNRPLSGKPRAAVRGSRLVDQIPRGRRAEIERRIAAVGERGEIQHFELPITAEDGKRWYSCRIGPVRHGDEITALVVVAQDVTHLRRVQEEGRQLEDQLRQAQKMESIGQLAGGVAHDFNNLLVVIQGHAEFARESVAPGSPEHTDLGSVLEASERAAELTRQLLAFSRRQVLQPTDLVFNQVLTDHLKILHRIIGEHIKLQLIPGPDLATVHADRGQIEQVIMNLCVNARAALPKGGTITLETRNRELDRDFCERNAWAREGRYVQLSVTDNGVGMDAETLEQIFEPFFTTKEAGTGTGLGLSMVYGIVKQHEGLIDVTSKPGEGTTFEIYLPVAESPAAAPDVVELEAPEGGAETILVAEDEKLVRDLVVRILEMVGYQVLTAANGAEAVELFAERVDEIDLVLLDMVMPVMGGIEAREAMLDIDAGARFLFSSGYRSEIPQLSASQGVDLPLVPKPYRRESLLRKVREVLDD